MTASGLFYTRADKINIFIDGLDKNKQCRYDPTPNFHFTPYVISAMPAVSTFTFHISHITAHTSTSGVSDP